MQNLFVEIHGLPTTKNMLAYVQHQSQHYPLTVEKSKCEILFTFIF